MTAKDKSKKPTTNPIFRFTVQKYEKVESLWLMVKIIFYTFAINIAKILRIGIKNN
jgi:hypothetical protein